LGFADRIHFVESNLFTAFGRSPVAGHDSLRFHLIACNPPYIGRREADQLAREVRDQEPEMALFGGEGGYELYAGLVTQCDAHLRPGGILVLELGHDSLAAVQPLFDTPDWTNTKITKDLAGIPRVLSSERTSAV